MREWIRSDIQQSRVELIAAYLFGSSIHAERRARDVDLVLVAPGKAGDPSWYRVIVYRDALKPRFDDAFWLPLSAMVVTLSEWTELDGVVVRERVSIF